MKPESATTSRERARGLASFRKKARRCKGLAEPKVRGRLLACKYETNPFSDLDVYLPAFQRLERKEGLRELSPERRLIAAEPVHDLAVEIRQA